MEDIVKRDRILGPGRQWVELAPVRHRPAFRVGTAGVGDLRMDTCGWGQAVVSERATPSPGAGSSPSD